MPLRVVTGVVRSASPSKYARPNVAVDPLCSGDDA